MNNSTNIDIPFPEAEQLHLRFSVGACRLRLRPGDGDQWVAGTYEDPSNAVPLRITQEGGTVRISQSLEWPQAWGRVDRPPTFELALGKGRPYALTLEGGAGEAIVNLGGLPLRRLAVQQGAGRTEVNFSTPNPQPMSLLDVDGGAMGMVMRGLANANFAEMTLDGGAAGYELSFDGVLRREAQVRIETGLSGVTLRVPGTTAAKIYAQANLGGLEVGDGFMKQEGAFWTQAAVTGSTPVLTIRAQVTLGGLTLAVV
jgi:hypothetical protein